MQQRLLFFLLMMPALNHASTMSQIAHLPSILFVDFPSGFIFPSKG
jgi:hypothetical protein